MTGGLRCKASAAAAAHPWCNPYSYVTAGSVEASERTESAAPDHLC